MQLHDILTRFAEIIRAYEVVQYAAHNVQYRLERDLLTIVVALGVSN